MSKGIKILIVEDDENLRFLVVHRLKSEGYEVLEVGDGESAEQMILEESLILFCWTGCCQARKVRKSAKQFVSKGLKI